MDQTAQILHEEFHQLSKEQMRILEEELEAYKTNPDEGSSWEEVKSSVLKGKK